MRNAKTFGLVSGMVAGLVASATVLAQPAGEPGPNGPGLGNPATGAGSGSAAPTSPNTPAPPAPVPGVAASVELSADEKEALKDIEAEYGRYLQQAEQHNERMRAVVSREYQERQAELEKRYAEKIAKSEVDRKARHADTIALLEKFILEHPNHEQFTPDGMFRLADLYLDEADEQVEIVAQTNPDAIADYSKSLALWETILTKFPKYRQTPSTLYLAAYYGKMKDERRSLQMFLALACANHYKWADIPPEPPTREEALARTEAKQRRDPYADCQPMENADAELVRHAWVRGIADYHFTVPGELDEAIAAYLKVADVGKDSPLYAEALYKLAWSYYKRDFLLDSIQKFDESVKHYDAIVAQGGTPTLELRDESIQYIAVAFTDPWEGETDSDPVKGFDRARNFYKGRENEPHVRDVWVAMGHAFQELQAYDQAIDSFKIALGPPWELDPHNPQTHQEIVNTFEAKGDKFAADAAAAELAIRYAPGTAWYTANEKDREAMEAQRRLAERALYAAARNTHANATQLRKEYDAGGKKDAQIKSDYMALYAKTVELYTSFMAQYPDSDYIYEFTYLRGEANFFSENYLAAVDDYRWVRDHRDMSQQFYLDAAKSILAAYEAEADKQVAAGLIAPLKVPTAEELKALPQPLQPQPIPDIYQKLQAEWDDYQNKVDDPKTAPQQGINAALVSLAYLHIPDTELRLKKVMNKFCGDPVAVRAKDSLLAVYEATSQLDKFEQTNNEFIRTNCGDTASIELAKSQNRSIEFKRAVELYAKKQYIPAAESFYTYYKTAPAGDPDLPKALYNAAVNYKLGEKPKTAISLFKEFTDSKDKAFRESSYYLDALRLTALSYQGAYDYQNAIAGYLNLYEVAKGAKKRGINPPEPIPGEQPRTIDQIAMEALYNAAFVSELNRDFKKAVELYTKYEKEETVRRQKDRAAWSIANIYKSSNSVSEAEEYFDRWRKKYGNDTGNEDDYVRSFYEVARMRKAKGQTTAADKEAREAIAAWKKKGSVQGSKGAEMAGEWALAFAEREYASFDRYFIRAIPKTDAKYKGYKAEIEKRANAVKALYEELKAYGVAELTMAQLVRTGDILAGFGEKVAAIPMPADLQKLAKKNPDAEIQAKFEEAIGQALKKYIDEARKLWAEVVEAGKQRNVSNKWTQLALESLNREFPDEFPVLHQELFDGTEAP
jgi:cellulose synthase operon protein C